MQMQTLSASYIQNESYVNISKYWINYLFIYLLSFGEIMLKMWVIYYTYRRSRPKVFLEMLQNSQENNCARVSFLIKLQASGSTQ